jgi:hypothetical protein
LRWEIFEEKIVATVYFEIEKRGSLKVARLPRLFRGSDSPIYDTIAFYFCLRALYCKKKI